MIPGNGLCSALHLQQQQLLGLRSNQRFEHPERINGQLMFPLHACNQPHLMFHNGVNYIDQENFWFSCRKIIEKNKHSEFYSEIIISKSDSALKSKWFLIFSRYICKKCKSYSTTINWIITLKIELITIKCLDIYRKQQVNYAFLHTFFAKYYLIILEYCTKFLQFWRKNFRLSPLLQYLNR